MDEASGWSALLRVFIPLLPKAPMQEALLIFYKVRVICRLDKSMHKNRNIPIDLNSIYRVFVRSEVETRVLR